MRTALLSAVKRTESGDLRAALTLGGRSVLEWQVELAQQLGCSRIICLCETPSGEVLSMQRRVEFSGGEFHAIRRNLQLASLVRADDEIVMLLDGLVIDRSIAAEFAGPDLSLRKVIASIPAEHAFCEEQPEDFERIDRNRHWAGLAMLGADKVHKLADLPPDGNAMSLLLRMGLQSMVDCRDIETESLNEQRWMLATDSFALAERERALIDAGSQVQSWMGPGRALSAFIVQRFAPRGLEQGVEVSTLLAAILLLAGIVLAGFGFGIVALSSAAIGAFAAVLSEAWAGLRKRLWSVEQDKRVAYALPIGVDFASALILILAYGFQTNVLLQISLPQLSLPILAIGITHHVANKHNGNAAAFWSDRPLHLVLFAISAATGYLGEALAVFGLLALAQLLLSRDDG